MKREDVLGLLHHADIVENIHGRSLAGGPMATVSTDQLRALCERWLAVEDAATGECVEVGDDEDGQPRVLVHSTRDELRRGRPLAFQRVRIVPEGGGDGR